MIRCKRCCLRALTAWGCENEDNEGAQHHGTSVAHEVGIQLQARDLVHLQKALLDILAGLIQPERRLLATQAGFLRKMRCM